MSALDQTGTVTGIEKEPALPTALPAERWHDLDALRGFAMLLGIGLHASLSFFPWVWPAQDTMSSVDGWYDEFFHAVHGFRMPLFFLLSGFFTAMLWRRRGLSALIQHRLRRIALPLLLAMVTVVPAVTWSVEWAVDNGVADYIEVNDDIWAAVFFGNTRAVEQLLDQGVGVNVANEADMGNTPLHIAAYTNDVAMVDLLLERGADPNIRATDGTPVDYAIFVGNEEAADVLVAAGAFDPRPAGEAWSDISFWAAGAGEIIDQDTVLGLESWLASFYHLWFLWFLLWLVAAFALVVLAVDRVSPRAAPQRSLSMMWALIPLTMIPQLAMGDGGEVPVFGPDTSTGLIPKPHVLGYYAIFFSFGALLFGRKNRDGARLAEALGVRWKILLPIAVVVVLPLALRITFETETTSWVIVSLAQVTYTWLMIVALMGLFHSFLAREKRGVRYLSDSSYWLYLAHLPLIILGQSLIRNWDLPAGVKIVGLTVTVTALLLISYQLFVRYTPIGTLLNGRRTRPGPSRGLEDSVA